MKYNVDYFIYFFKSIPENKWCTKHYTNDARQHCAYGHLGIGGTIINNKKSLSLKSILRDVIKINDGKNILYQQETPRARILSALMDVKKDQNGKV